MTYSDLYWDDVHKVVEQIPHVSNLFGKSILITGATGLIGSSIADILLFLNKEYNAKIHIVLAGRNKQKLSERFYFFSENIDFYFLQYEATSFEMNEIHIDYVIHSASNADPKMISEQPVETILSNIIGLSTLFKSAKETQRFLYISSSEVYGRKKDNNPYKEEDFGFVDILNPRASYPSSKRLAETLCAAYGKEYKKDFVIVRPGHIYGPTASQSDTRASSQFPRDILLGRNIVMKSSGTQLRSYCYCLDCASAILSVLINGKNGDAYNVSNKDSIVTIRQMAEAFAVAGNVEIVLDIPSDNEKASFNLMDNSNLDSSKIEALGWKAIFSMNEGAKRTLLLM